MCKNYNVRFENTTVYFPQVAETFALAFESSVKRAKEANNTSNGIFFSIKSITEKGVILFFK